MSSRLAVPVSKFTRSISTTPSIARPSHLLNNVSKSASGRIRQSKVASADDTEADPDSTRFHSTSPNRPTLSPTRTLPLMQGFRTSAPKPAAPTLPTLDSIIFPDLSAFDGSAAAADPYAHIRVPLLPDNDSPLPQFRRPEAEDVPLPKPVISVVAARPETVLPAALTEVEGMGVDGVELKFAHDLHAAAAARERGPDEGMGMLKDIWKGMVDDVLGEKGQVKTA